LTGFEFEFEFSSILKYRIGWVSDTHPRLVPLISQLHLYLSYFGNA